MMTAWFARLYSSIALSIRSSQRSGELQLISEIETGALSSASRRRTGSPPSRRCRARSRPRSRSPCTACPTASGARTPCRGGASRAAGPPARRRCRRPSPSRGTSAPSLTKFSKSAILASPRYSPSRTNGGPYTPAKTMWSPPMWTRVLRVARLQLELAAAPSPPARARTPGRGRPSRPPPSGRPSRSTRPPRAARTRRRAPETMRRQPLSSVVHRLLAQDLVAGHFVHEHGTLLDEGRGGRQYIRHGTRVPARHRRARPVIDRGAQLLALVLEADAPRGLTDLAQDAGLPKSTASRLSERARAQRPRASSRASAARFRAGPVLLRFARRPRRPQPGRAGRSGPWARSPTPPGRRSTSASRAAAASST